MQPSLECIIEGALLAAGRALSINELEQLFIESDPWRPTGAEIEQALGRLAETYAERALELKYVGSGVRLQVRASLAPWVARLWDERPPRYSRAVLETLALIAYRQPITRAEIEQVRGVSVGTPIMRSLLEREWVRVVGHREVPGRPALYATTRAFLDYFNLASLDELPPLRDIADLEAEAARLADGIEEASGLQAHAGEADVAEDVGAGKGAAVADEPDDRAAGPAHDGNAARAFDGPSDPAISDDEDCAHDEPTAP